MANLHLTWLLNTPQRRPQCVSCAATDSGLVSGLVWNCIVLFHIALCCITSFCAVPPVLNCTILHCMVLCCVCCVEPNHIKLCHVCVVLHSCVHHPMSAHRGWAVSVTQVLLFAAPLSTLYKAIRARSSASFHLGMGVLGFLSSAMWTVYGGVSPVLFCLGMQQPCLCSGFIALLWAPSTSLQHEWHPSCHTV